MAGGSANRSVLGATVLALLSAAALADPFWYTWEGDRFPEEDPGWKRIYGDKLAKRWLEDGKLFID